MKTRLHVAIVGFWAMASMAGCGGATHAPRSLAAVCAQASVETRAIYRTRVRPLVGSFLPVIGPSSKEAAPLEAAAAEVATVDRAAAAGIRPLEQTPATLAALAHLAENEKQLLAMRAPRDEPGLVMRFVDFGGASGGCRRFSTATGRWSGL